MIGHMFREIFLAREPRVRPSNPAGAATRQATGGGDDTQSSVDGSV
jgi:hypothetical protein